MPAQAGIQVRSHPGWRRLRRQPWPPAFAGTTIQAVWRVHRLCRR